MNPYQCSSYIYNAYVQVRGNLKDARRCEALAPNDLTGQNPNPDRVLEAGPKHDTESEMKILTHFYQDPLGVKRGARHEFPV